MKLRLLALSVFDKCFICGVVIVIGVLFFIPFFNHNNRAIFYMALKQYEKAEKKWLHLLSENSFAPFYRMNLALNYMLFDQPDKAIREYELTRNLLKVATTKGRFKIQNQSKVKDDMLLNNSEEVKIEAAQKEELYKNKILFYSFFNSAVASIQKGKRESALDFYQQALGLYSDSLEVKTNIELLAMGSQSSQNKEQNDKDKSEKKGNDEGKDSVKSSSENQEENKKEESSSKKDKEDNEKDGENEKGDKESKKEDKEEEKQDSQESKDDSSKKSDQSLSKSQLRRQNDENKKNVNEKQKEAILKAILEQEKKIRERRNQEGKRKSSPIEKDW